MAAQEAENTAYGIIYFLYITAQGRSDEPRTKSCSAKASTIWVSSPQCRICTESICAISRVSRCIERRIHPYKRESVGRMSCGLRFWMLQFVIHTRFIAHNVRERYKMEQEKQRIIQEFVPGKQVTLAHVIANPDSSLYKKLGVIGDYTGALGIMTITPSEGAIIGADVAMKAANVEVVFVDRFNGSLIINGTVADVEAAVKDVLNVLENTLHFAPTVITKS